MSTCRLEFLRKFLSIYRIDRPFIHSFIYWLWRKLGQEIPREYRDCRWELTMHGVYCEEIENDLEKLFREGYIRQSFNGSIVLARGSQPIDVNSISEIVKEASEIYIRDLGGRMKCRTRSYP